MRKSTWIIVLIAAVLEMSTAAPSASDRILFLTIRMKNGTVELLSSDIINRAHAFRGDRDEGPIRYAAFAASGKELFSATERDPSLVPYDYMETDGTLRGGVMEQSDAVATVRIPYSETIDAVGFFRRASGSATGETSIGSFKMAAILGKRSKAGSTGGPRGPDIRLVYGDSTKKRVNYIVLSEGYTLNELDNGKFIADCKKGVDHHFACTPFKEYRSYFNVWAISVASAKSGINGYFESKMDGRLIYLSDAGNKKVASVLQTLMPDYDLVLVLINVTAYGGSGADFATATVNSQCGELIAHETGHGFCLLGDEYDYRGRSGAEAPNTTKETNYNLIKWNTWIASSTPVPTPETSEWSSVIGLFEGAEYNSTGWYRPKLKCKMKELTVPFCDVCVETAIARSYKALSPIETHTPASAMLKYDTMSDKRLAVTTMQPLGQTVKTDWIVNGTLVLNERDTLDLTTANLLAGLNTVQAIVTDVTPMVRIAKNLSLLKDTAAWTVRCDNTPSLDPEASPSRMTISFRKINGSACLDLGVPNAGVVWYLITGIDGGTIICGTVKERRRVYLGRLSNGLYTALVRDGEARFYSQTFLYIQ